jgi:uncharacterized protein
MLTLMLEDIPEEGLELRWEEKQDALLVYLSHLSSIDFEFETPLHGEATIRKVGRSYLIHGAVQGRLRLRCVRCLKEFAYPLSSIFDLSLHPLKESAHEEEIELGEEDLKSSFFEGGEIRLSEMACEQVFLEIPFKPLCMEDCKGLCPKCGWDLNQSSCECTREDWEKGFSVLRKLKLDPS